MMSQGFKRGCKWMNDSPAYPLLKRFLSFPNEKDKKEAMFKKKKGKANVTWIR